MYLPPKQTSWIYAHCMEFLALKEQVHSLVVRVADLEKLGQREWFGD